MPSFLVSQPSAARVHHESTFEAIGHPCGREGVWRAKEAAAQRGKVGQECRLRASQAARLGITIVMLTIIQQQQLLLLLIIMILLIIHIL